MFGDATETEKPLTCHTEGLDVLSMYFALVVNDPRHALVALGVVEGLPVLVVEDAFFSFHL